MELIDGYQTCHQVLIHWTLERRDGDDEDENDDIFTNKIEVMRNTVSIRLWKIHQFRKK